MALSTKNMTAMARLSLFFICCYPSLSLAWCSGVDSGSVVGRRQQLHTSKSNLVHHRFAKNLLHRPQLYNKKDRRDGVQLCSIIGGSQDDDTDTTTSSTDKMTLQKASSLLKTFWKVHVSVVSFCACRCCSVCIKARQLAI